MHKASSKTEKNPATLQEFLETLTGRRPFEKQIADVFFQNRNSLIACAQSLAHLLIEIINANALPFEKICGHNYAAPVYEAIRQSVVRLLAEHAAEPCQFREFVEAYEFLLEQRLSGRAGSFRLVSSQNEKRRRGVFYTPDALAQDLTVRAFLPLVVSDADDFGEQRQARLPSAPNSLVSVEKLLSLKIVDPAMGAGTFLLSALDVLTECVLSKLEVDKGRDDWRALSRHVESATEFRGGAENLQSLDIQDLRRLTRQTIAIHCLYGLDVDGAAVELAKLAMAKHCRLPLSTASSEFRNLRQGNALIGMWRNPEAVLLSDSLRKIRRKNADFVCVGKNEIERLSDKDRRDLVCLSFFSGLTKMCRSRPDTERMIAGLNFCHWDLEFPEVFSGAAPGFDLVLTNPPWEIEKANSREFFTRYDPDYMTLGKQAALGRQEQLLAADQTVEEEWRHYVAYHDGVSEFLQRSADMLYSKNSCDVPGPFSHQGGGDSNSYKLFLELGYHLLKQGGVMAQIVPSGIYSDKGATGLRRLFIERCRWLFLDGYHNREGLFSIHRSFKFCSLAVVKGGRTQHVDCSFLRLSPRSADFSVPLAVDMIKRLSPRYLAFTEVPHGNSLRLIEKLVGRSSPLITLSGGAASKGGDEKFEVSFRREFDMTNDSRFFVDRAIAQQEGFALDTFGHWLKGKWRPIDEFNANHVGELAVSADGQSALAIDDIARVLLPVYEGRMIGQYDWAKKAWLQGKGRRADWQELGLQQKRILPQYLLELNDYLAMQPQRGAKIAYLAVGAATNSRSCIAAMIGDWPCGNSVPVLSTGPAGAPNYEQLSALLACLNSFVFDYLLRLRLSANNLNWFILQECLVPDLSKLAESKELHRAVCELSGHEALRAEGLDYGLSHHESPTELAARRLKLRAFVEAVIAHAYAIDEADCRLILSGCWLGEAESKTAKGSAIDKGFHRLDLHLPADLRGPYLFFRSFRYLKEMGPQWLFEHLDSDDVLFSHDYFKNNYLPNMMSHMVPERAHPAAIANLSASMNGAERKVLMSRIRRAGLEARSAPALPKAGSFGALG